MAEIPQDISGLPVVQPTPEEVSAYEQQFGPPPLNPIRDLTAAELADLASADKENFELVSAFRQNKDLWADQNVVSKVADAHNLIRQRGFSLSDLPTPKRAAGLALDVAKGFGKQLWNYGSAAVETAMGIGADLTGQEGIARELEQQAQQRVAENIAGSEQALFGLADMAGRAIQKTGRAVGIAKPLAAQTPQEKIADLWTAVGTGEAQEDIGRGAGGFLQPVGGEVIAELEAAGKPVRPEETAALAAGDPFSFYTFGKGFQIAGGAVPQVARQAAAQVGQRAGAVAEKVAGAGVRALGKLTELGGRAAEITGKAAPVVAATGAAISGQPVTALAILGGGTTAGRAVQVAGRGAAAAGKEVSEVGRQVAGKPIVSPLAQGVRDVAGALPGAASEIITGTAADIGLAAVSAETPQQTESAVGIGTVLGAAGGAKRIAGRVISGQLIAPREYGVTTPVASSGNFPLFDRMHSAAYSAAPPGVRARLNAVREFASGAKVDTDVFLASDTATLERALIESGVDSATAKTFSEQEGFFTTSLPDRAGNPRRVIIARNVEATPHESFHAFQDVLGESANRELDALVRSEYGPQWDAEGTRYAQRLVGDLGNRAWEEVILDESGWGLDAAKEKIFREVYNMVESETGSAPPDAHVRDLADPELVRIFNEAQSRNPNARPDQFWREILSPEEAKSEADRYIARELAAENFDAVFKQRGAGLQTRPGLLQRLSRVVGNTMSTLGAEPLAGRRTEIGQIEPRFRVTERVAELAQGDVQQTTPAQGDVQQTTPVAPARGTLPSTPEGRQQVADEARAFAEQAPAEPVVGGTRSPRELLGQIAEAIAQQAGVRINYLSAPGEPAAATTSNRTVRREIIEAFRTMPQAARSLWEKSFFPERVRKTSKGFQVMGWAPEVFASNAHKLAQTLSALPGGERLTPYPLDVANKTFTDAGWQQLFADTQNFVRNQMAGQTGAGSPLVVPRDLTDRGFFAPQATPSRAVDLAQPQADTINMLFNLRIPETPRIESGKFPLNVAGQEVSIATAGGPQRLSVPVEPRAPFSGERAQALGIEGRSILEVNPVRAAIESAAKQAKLELPSFIEARQNLNLENIKEVELAPELPQFRGNTLTLTAGFQPSADPRAVKSAAVRDEQGKIYEGSWHGEAMDVALSERVDIPDTAPMSDFFVDGFTTNSGEFLTREQALNRAIELQQVPAEMRQEERFARAGVLESTAFDAFRQFQPVAESARRMTEMTPEEWLSTVRNYKGKLGSGLTGWAWDLGSQAKSVEDVLALRSASEALREASKTGTLNQRLEIIGRAQAAREAYEAATGRNLEDTNDGSAVPGIRKFVDPNYNPPVPLGTPATREQMVATFQAQPAAAKVTADDTIRDLATRYAKSAGVEYAPTGETIPVNENLAKRLADIYDSAQHTPADPEVAASYTALGDETLAQYRAIADAGYTIEPWTGAGEPYKSSAEMVADVRNNKHLYFLPTEGAFSDAGGNLMLRDAGIELSGKKLSVNDVFRAVHDFFGHAKEGHQFGPRGELNAWVSHSEMFSDAAQGALAAETLAQNSWVNYGTHLRDAQGNVPRRGEPGYLGPTERPFAEQKNIVIPDAIIQEARGKIQAQPESQEFKLRKPAAGGMFSKAWILPDGSPVQLGGKWHHEWVNENQDVIERFEKARGLSHEERDERVSALRAGFARINYSRNGGQLTVEARAADWAKLRPSVQQFVETNIDQIDNIRVELLNDDVTATTDSKSVRFMDLNSDAEKLAAIPFLESAPSGGAAGGSVTGIAQARARQFQPGAEDWTPETAKERLRQIGFGIADSALSSGLGSQLLKDTYRQLKLPDITVNEKPITAGSGLISPDGKMVSTAPFEHLDKISELYPDIAPFFRDAGIAEEAFSKRERELEDQTEVNEFHQWSDARDDLNTLQNSQWETLYNHGWVRIGPVKSGGKLIRIEAEGTKRALSEHKKTIADAAIFSGLTDKDVFTQIFYPEKPNEGSQFQPRAEEQQEFGGMGPAGARPMLTTSQLASMSRKELMDHFPEAIVPKRSADTIPSKLREAPLVKDVDDPVQTYSDKLAEFARSVDTTPEYQMGRKWYSEFSEQLKARFGADARVFAELLAATSPQTSVESNFKFALDALEGFKSGRFKQNIKKFEQGLSMMANDKWLAWYNRELNAGRIENPPAKPTPAAFMARWIQSHDIKPRQSNGKLFGINSIPVLQVAARRWLEQNKGPKVKNFVENLLGEGTEATIDLWADRTLRRLGYSDFQERWRIMPVNKQGVSDEDFSFAQSIFRNAAGQLGMKPSELQAAVWFAEKQLWADNGWSRLDLGDFREQLKRTDALRAEIRGWENAAESTPDLISVEPRGRISAVKSQAQPNPFDFPAQYIDSGFWEISKETATKIAGGQLPSEGRDRRVTYKGQNLVVSRTLNDGNQVWSVRERATRGQ